MKLTQIIPKKALKTLNDKFWYFESGSVLPLDQANFIAPNGKLKLIYTWANGLIMESLKDQITYHEIKIYIISI